MSGRGSHRLGTVISRGIAESGEDVLKMEESWIECKGVEIFRQKDGWVGGQKFSLNSIRR
jgi:hypothetical protein